jgi:hypothetical protein
MATRKVAMKTALQQTANLVLAFDIGAFDQKLEHVVRATFFRSFQQLISSFRILIMTDIRCGMSAKSCRCE